MMTENEVCSRCIKVAVRDKYFNRRLACSSCRIKGLCPHCIEFRFKDEILKLYQLTKMLLRSRAALKEHRFELFTFEMDFELCTDRLKCLSSELNEDGIDIIKTGKIISDCEEKFNNLYETSCMKRAQNQEDSETFWPRTNFLFSQMTAYRNSTVWKIFCSTCNKKFDENDLINSLICGHCICNTCLPEPSCLPNPSCKLCQHSKNDKVDLQKNIKTYVDVLLEEFEGKRIEFQKHFSDIAEIPQTISDGLHCLKTIIRKCYQAGKFQNIREVKEEIRKWEWKLKTIEITICKTKGPGKPYNTILFDEYEWGFRLSHIHKYLHEVVYMVKNGQKVYAMNKINGHLKFGEFLTDENHFFFNTLTLNEAEDEAFFVKLNDIKICAGTLYFPFITINWKEEINKEVNEEDVNQKKVKNFKIHELRFVVKIHHPNVARQFIDYCTGEDGLSYQYSLYKRGRIREKSFESILYFPTDLKKKENKVYDVYEIVSPPFPNRPEHNKDDIFIIGSQNGSFSVCRSLKDGLEINSIGVVLTEVDFSKIKFEKRKSLKVVNCGMQILHF